MSACYPSLSIVLFIFVAVILVTPLSLSLSPSFSFLFLFVQQWKKWLAHLNGMRDTQSLWVNCSAIISLLIASLGRHESKRSPRVTKSATLTHWPALGRQSFPLHVTLLPLPINLFLPPSFFVLETCLGFPLALPPLFRFHLSSRARYTSVSNLFLL